MPHAIVDEVPTEVIRWVERLHEVVDEVAAPIAAAHGSRLRCGEGCSGCCSDELGVFAIEAAVIAQHHPELLERGAPHAEGACAFLDDRGACRVYAHRPYVCRTQGLPLRWLERDDDGEPIEARDVCPLNADGQPLEELAPDTLFTLGPFEQRLADRQAAIDGGEGRRVALRDLFRARATADEATPGSRRRLPVVP